MTRLQMWRAALLLAALYTAALFAAAAVAPPGPVRWDADGTPLPAAAPAPRLVPEARTWEAAAAQMAGVHYLKIGADLDGAHQLGAVKIGKAEVGIYCYPLLTAGYGQGFHQGVQLEFSKFKYEKGQITFLVYSQFGHRWREPLQVPIYNGNGVRLKTLSLAGTTSIGAGESVRIALTVNEQTEARALVIVVPYDLLR